MDAVALFLNRGQVFLLTETKWSNDTLMDFLQR
jgi:hypothetical protein